MAYLAKAITDVMESFERLPGIGPKSSARLAYYLLCLPQNELDKFAKAVSELKIKTTLCSICFGITDTDPCEICGDKTRQENLILVVEQPLDVLAFERGGGFPGLYHVLHGTIAPLKHIGPEDLKIEELMKRIKKLENVEIILAMNNNLEGETTAMYLSRNLKFPEREGQVTISRLAKGIPMGGEIEFADEITLRRALEGRTAV